MATNLVGLAGHYLKPEVIQKASALVEASPEATLRALSAATPAIVLALAAEASAPSGADRLKRILDEESGPGAAHMSLSELLRTGSGEDLVQRGTGLLSRTFGHRMGSLVESTADASGTPTSTMASLLGLAAPVVFGVLGHQVRARHLDAAGLADLLADEKRALHPLSPDVAAAAASSHPAVPPPPPPPPPARTASRLWPLLLLLPVLLVAGVLLHHREAPPARLGAGLSSPDDANDLRAIPEITLPPGTVVEDLSAFLVTPDGAPSRSFVFEALTFAAASPDLPPGAAPTLDAVAAALKASPGAQVLVEGHADATDAAAGNPHLALDRAGAVKDALAARGVEAGRITVVGIGAGGEGEGSAPGRGVELVVTRHG